MKQYENKRLNEAYFYKKLNNGLDVYVIEKAEFSTSSCFLGTKFGSIHLNQVINGINKQFHSGIAHFLEHKMFESKTGDVLELFTDLDCSANAYTSFLETVYYFTTVSNQLEKGLNLLLDFVQKLEINEESVDKEKEIIVQEVLMYKNNPNARLLQETMKSVFHNYGTKEDIGGEIEDIRAITKQELEDCYYANYHPSNMVLVVLSPFSYNEIISIIEKNQNSKTFLPIDCNNVEVNEPKTVKRDYFHFKMNVEKTKISYAIKLNHTFENVIEMLKFEQGLKFAFEMLFTSLNPEYQTWIDQHLINDYFDYEIDVQKNHQLLIFFNETEDEHFFKEFIDKQLKNFSFTEDKMVKLKRRYLSKYFKTFNNIEHYGYEFSRCVLEGVDLFTLQSILESITLEDIYHSMEKISTLHHSLIKLTKETR